MVKECTVRFYQHLLSHLQHLQLRGQTVHKIRVYQGYKVRKFGESCFIDTCKNIKFKYCVKLSEIIGAAAPAK